MGSAIGGRIPDEALVATLTKVLLAAIGLSALYWVSLEPITTATVGLGTVARCSIAALVIAPMGLLLGLPFPSGLRLLREHSHLTPWMWALNGGSSVFGATAATMAVIHLGFAPTLLVGGAIYGVALSALRLGPAGRAS